ncbi:MAG: hypothetical protein ACLSHW_06525 [Lachnospiraceae bacterium]
MEPWDRSCLHRIHRWTICLARFWTATALRPSRYYITDDDHLILASEVGALDIDRKKQS